MNAHSGNSCNGIKRILFYGFQDRQCLLQGSVHILCIAAVLKKHNNGCLGVFSHSAVQVLVCGQSVLVQ